MNQFLEILRLGAVGFTFLMASLSYRLLRAEQARPQDPRPRMVTSTIIFMVLATIAALGHGFVEYRLRAETGIVPQWYTQGDRIQIRGTTLQVIPDNIHYANAMSHVIVEDTSTGQQVFNGDINAETTLPLGPTRRLKLLQVRRRGEATPEAMLWVSGCAH